MHELGDLQVIGLVLFPVIASRTSRPLPSKCLLVLCRGFVDKCGHDTGAIGFDRMPTRPGWRAEGQAPRKSDWKTLSANTHYSLAA